MSEKRPKVLIVGAGLGGLFLAITLERINIDYEIFERANSIKPLGAGMALTPNILPAIEQLGLLDDLVKISNRFYSMDVYAEDLTKIGQSGPVDSDKIGYEGSVFSRPEFHQLLLSKVPKEKINFGKRVLTIGQSQHGVLLRCADNTQYEGDILIGADGAYSAVRASLYERLAKEDRLPKSDSDAMNVGYGCIVGTTLPLDPEKYPVLKDDISHFAIVLADNKPLSCTVISIPGNRFCFGVVFQLDTDGNDVAFRNSEWGPESIDTATASLMDYKIPFGGTLGDLINATPKDSISNVYLEEKIFKTWNHGRVALIGDACHKMLPSAGQGAVNALEDAVILANCLYEVESFTQVSIDSALSDYKSQRYKHAKYQVDNSAGLGKILYGQTWIEKMLRKIVFGYMPKWFENNSAAKATEYRPQLTFLPKAPQRGTVKVLPQKESKRILNKQDEKKEINVALESEAAATEL